VFDIHRWIVVVVKVDNHVVVVVVDDDGSSIIRRNRVFVNHLSLENQSCLKVNATQKVTVQQQEKQNERNTRQ